MAPSDNFFYTGAIFVFFVKKCKKCLLPYEEVLEDIIKAVWTEQYVRYPGKAAHVCPG